MSYGLWLFNLVSAVLFGFHEVINMIVMKSILRNRSLLILNNSIRLKTLPLFRQSFFVSLLDVVIALVDQF